MSGWKFCAIAGALAVVAGSELARAGIASGAPAAGTDAVSAVVESLTDGDLAGALPGGEGIDPLPAAVTTQATPAVVPLPPGVVAGLVGLASAAVARRRYLRRH